jgi:outer membrane lipoprotein carrier protein
MTARSIVFVALAAVVILGGALLLILGRAGQAPGPRADGPAGQAPVAGAPHLDPGTFDVPPGAVVADSDGAPAAAPEESDAPASPAPPRPGGASTPAGQAPGPAPAAPPPPPLAQAGQDAGTAEILRATARRYEQVRSLSAEFEQEMRNPLLGNVVRSRGTLFQRQPDRFLMRFSDPDGDVIVSDGEHFWLYYPSVDARQVIRAPRGPQGLDLHAQFIGDPVRRFDATNHGREAVRGRPAHVLTLVPREPLGYRTLKVWIDAEDHLVRRFELTEDNGNLRRFELSNVQINPTLRDDLFRFTPPPGAQVIQR